MEIQDRGLRALFRELGVADTVRFLRQFATGFGNYTQDRETLFARMSVKEIVRDMARRPKRGGDPTD